MSSLPVFFSGFALSITLIAAIGPQNAHVLRMGLSRKFVLITVLACSLTDVALIAIGVLGFAKISQISKVLQNIILIAAILFLVHYGWLAARRVWRKIDSSLEAVQNSGPQTAKQALLTALAFSWLNPHAWLDTAVLIGSASVLHLPPSNYVFGFGAAAGSFVWFAALALIATALAPHLKSPKVWRAIDAFVAITMWGTAIWLIQSMLQ